MATFLLYTVIILAIVAVAHLVRILELSAELSRKKAEEDEEEITPADNRMNAFLLILFLVAGLAGVTYMTVEYGQYVLPEAASVHGITIDNLFNLTMIIIGVVFIITQIMLFYFGYKYKFNKEKKALFYPDDHKLEIIWTVVPGVVLIALVLYGLVVWDDVMDEPLPKNAMVIEVYGKQFDWTARYAGKDNKLGKTSYKLINGPNELGIDSASQAGFDDVIVKELHLPVNTPISMQFRSREVIHSAYLPHFRVQMNTVPGMVTGFNFVPTKTTQDMRKITGNPNFEYILLCNKICGVAHYNMKMKVVVHSKEDFAKWMNEQKTFLAGPVKQAAETPQQAEVVKNDGKNNPKI